MEINYRCFHINLHLERHVEALKFIDKVEDSHFEECLQFIQKYNLYSQAIQIFISNEDKCNKIKDLFGEYLASQNNHLEAALVWSTSGQEEKAIMSFKRCGHWRKVIYLSQKIGKTNIIEIARDMAYELEENLKYKDAAFIFETYCNDFDSALKVLLKGDLYDDAIRICYRNNKEDVIQNDIIPLVKDNCSTLLTQIVEKNNQVIKYYDRIIEYRYNKLRAPKNVFQDDDVGSVAESDVTQSSYNSYTSSVKSGTTYHSNRTVGGTKKTMEKKRKKKKI